MHDIVDRLVRGPNHKKTLKRICNLQRKDTEHYATDYSPSLLRTNLSNVDVHSHCLNTIVLYHRLNYEGRKF